MLSLAPHPPGSKNFATKAAIQHARVSALVSANGNVPRKEHFTTAELWRDHKLEFPAPRKCGYCEVPRPSSELAVEHYRPKSAVTEWAVPNWKLLSDVPKIPKEPLKVKNVEKHGYWWLAYEWENYLLACDSCNSAFKGNLFPVEGPRGPCREGGHSGEVALLLNPYEPFDTQDHFAWDDLGYIRHKSDRGLATILVCGLNSTDKVAERLLFLTTVYDPALRDFNANKDTLSTEQMQRLGARSAPHAGMVRWWFLSSMHFEVSWDSYFS